VLESIRYVDEVVSSKWLLTNEFLKKHEIDLLLHGDDNSNDISPAKLLVLPRTKGISSDLIRKRACKILKNC